MSTVVIKFVVKIKLGWIVIHLKTEAENFGRL